MSNSIAIFYGSTTGNTEFIAKKLHKQLNTKNTLCKNVKNLSQEELKAFDLLILGCSTWGPGLMQDDMKSFLDKYAGGIIKESKHIAFFALGDQTIYPESFAESLDKMASIFHNAKPKHIGIIKSENYFYADKLKAKHTTFQGLAIDEDNESNLSDKRIEKWIKQLKAENSSE